MSGPQLLQEEYITQTLNRSSEMWITGSFQISRVEIPHLTDDEHVPSLDDTLLHLGFQCLANVSFILMTVSCVNVAKTGGDAGFYCTLDCGGEKIGGLQQLKPGCDLAVYGISLKICSHRLKNGHRDKQAFFPQTCFQGKV